MCFSTLGALRPRPVSFGELPGAWFFRIELEMLFILLFSSQLRHGNQVQRPSLESSIIPINCHWDYADEICLFLGSGVTNWKSMFWLFCLTDCILPVIVWDWHIGKSFNVASFLHNETYHLGLNGLTKAGVTQNMELVCSWIKRWTGFMQNLKLFVV